MQNSSRDSTAPPPSGFTSSATSAAPESARFTFVDGLRGIAAFSVVLYHLVPWEAKSGIELEGGPLSRLLSPWAAHGWQGVTIFFVISGFVIAHSLRGAWVTPGFFGNFVLRRSIRLDPPYWVTIALVVILKVLSARVIPDASQEIPSTAQIVAHLFYLQNILGYGDICDVFWTLCMEVQFYLLFICLLAVDQRLRRLLSSFGRPTLSTWAIFLPIGLACHVYFQHALSENARDTWWLGHFHKFLLGAFAAWAVADRGNQALFCVFLAAFIGDAVWHGFDHATLLAAGTAATIYLVARRPWLGRSLEFRVTQYLGKISYSLYLLHVPIGISVWTIGRRLAQGSPWWQDAWVVAAILSSIIAAHVMYLLIESKSVEFAKRFKRPRRPAQLASA